MRGCASARVSAARRLRARCGRVDGDGEGVEVVQRRGALGEAQDLRDGLHGVQAVDQVARELEHGHAREECAWRRDSWRGRGARRRGSGAFFGAGLAPGEDEAGGHALDVPLEGAADGLVEVVDVEDEAAVGRGEGAEVADVGVAAELGEDAGVGAEREVAGHDGNGAAKEAEGRAAMRSYLMATSAGTRPRMEAASRSSGAACASFGLPAGMLGAAHMFALGLAQGEALARGRGMVRGSELWSVRAGLVARISGEGQAHRVRAS